jgi:tripartite-type tricarboxylate transporter receptor subunit TctC
VAEAGIPGFEAGFSLVMMAPSSTPKTVIDRVHKAVVAAVRDPALAQKLESQGYEIVGNSPAEYAVELEANIATNAKIIAEFRKAGVIQ